MEFYILKFGVFSKKSGQVLNKDVFNHLGQKVGIYSGEINEGKIHGKGEIIMTSGESYNGDWENGKKEGIGKNTFKSGDTYIGEWKDDRRNRKGKFTSSSGDVYDGEWKDDKKNGKGKYTYLSGDVYNGEWKDDKKNGKGRYTYLSGDKYNGEWKDDKKNGKGKFIYFSGDNYNGEWKDDRRNGEGTFTLKFNKYSIRGIWKDDQLVEFIEKKWNNVVQNSYSGVLYKIWKNDDFYEGVLHPYEGDLYRGAYDDEPHGYGKYIYFDKSELEGEWVRGVLKDGKGETKYKDGSRYIGEWKNYKYHGYGKYIFKDGLMIEGNWNDGNLSDRELKYKSEIGILTNIKTHENVFYGTPKFSQIPDIILNIGNGFLQFAYLDNDKEIVISDHFGDGDFNFIIGVNEKGIVIGPDAIDAGKKNPQNLVINPMQYFLKTYSEMVKLNKEQNKIRVDMDSNTPIFIFDDYNLQFSITELIVSAFRQIQESDVFSNKLNLIYLLVYDDPENSNQIIELFSKLNIKIKRILRSFDLFVISEEKLYDDNFLNIVIEKNEKFEIHNYTLGDGVVECGDSISCLFEELKDEWRLNDSILYQINFQEHNLTNKLNSKFKQVSVDQYGIRIIKGAFIIYKVWCGLIKDLLLLYSYKNTILLNDTKNEITIFEKDITIPVVKSEDLETASSSIFVKQLINDADEYFEWRVDFNSPEKEIKISIETNYLHIINGNYFDIEKLSHFSNGHLLYLDESKYEGGIKDYMKHGKGVLYDANGNVKLSGFWFNDKSINELVDQYIKDKQFDLAIKEFQSLIADHHFSSFKTEIEYIVEGIKKIDLSQSIASLGANEPENSSKETLADEFDDFM